MDSHTKIIGFLVLPCKVGNTAYSVKCYLAAVLPLHLL